jgi:hypothetical protein
MAVITALYDPLTILMANDFTDVVPPDHNRADGRTDNLWSVVSPRPCKIIGWSRIAADLRAHVPSAPRSRSTDVVVILPIGAVLVNMAVLAKLVMVMVVMTIVVMTRMIMMGSGLSGRSKQAN